MSWLARSIANTLKLDVADDEDVGDGDNNLNVVNNSDPASKPRAEDDQTSPPETPTGRGVKEDLSEITKTLTRQFWGVASFLAPPPSQISDSNRSEFSEQSLASDPENPDTVGIAGIRGDFAEIGEKFKTGISTLSSAKAVSEITKIASNFLQFGSEQDALADYSSAVGVTDEVLSFARNIAMHPETWMDFPLPDDEGIDDFDMSDAQQEHALAVERLAPTLAALRLELCPGYMSDDCFWMIYFVLLHPRLNKHDAELLTTPQILEARAKLMQGLQKPTRMSQPSWSETEASYPDETANSSHEEVLFVPSSAQSETPPPPKTSTPESATSMTPAELETDKHPVPSTEMKIIDKSVIEEEPLNQTKNPNPSPASSSSKVVDEKYEDEGDDWLKEETSDIGVVRGSTSIPIGNDEDVSFSDLEEDDDGDAPASYKTVTYGSDSSAKDSRDWVQLGKDGEQGGSEVRGRNPESSKESNDWLNVDDIDVM